MQNRVFLGAKLPLIGLSETAYHLVALCCRRRNDLGAGFFAMRAYRRPRWRSTMIEDIRVNISAIGPRKGASVYRNGLKKQGIRTHRLEDRPGGDIGGEINLTLFTIGEDDADARHIERLGRLYTDELGHRSVPP